MNRRRFLKGVGATAAAVSASALGLSLLPTTKGNSPPVADFSYKPRYLLPSIDQTIQFTNLSTNPDNAPLTFTWLVDGQSVTQEKDYSTKLPTGQHQIQLNASDGNTTVSKSATITVEADQLSDPAYQSKPLNVKYKGVRYSVGPTGSKDADSPIPSNQEMDEQLDTIHNELGCNAIIIFGGETYEDRMIQCGLIAIEKGFDKIYVQPSYMDATVDETVDKIGKFALKVKSLREKSNAITYMVGHEFQLETIIVPGSGATHEERWRYSQNNPQYWNIMKQILPQMLNSIIEVCKTNYGYQITYGATQPEVTSNLVPWSNPIFETIANSGYITDSRGWDEQYWLNYFKNLKQFGKPIIVSDFGMEKYAGADKYGGDNPLYMGNNPYDEEPQARYTVREINMFHQAGIDGCFWGYRYNDKGLGNARGHALYNPLTNKRTKDFYMYKSYQRVS